MLLNWYSYSITGCWNLLGRLFEKTFRHILIPLNWAPSVFYIALLSFLFVLWMVIMRNYYKDHKDKGLID